MIYDIHILLTLSKQSVLIFSIRQEFYSYDYIIVYIIEYGLQYTFVTFVILTVRPHLFNLQSKATGIMHGTWVRA